MKVSSFLSLSAYRIDNDWFTSRAGNIDENLREWQQRRIVPDLSLMDAGKVPPFAT
jgi:hypothetical protein